MFKKAYSNAKRNKYGESVKKLEDYKKKIFEMIQAYYAARGWDRDGQVPGAVKNELQLTDCGR